MTGDPSRGVHAELYVRSLAPRGAEDRQATVLETLDKLADRGALVDYDVRVCGQHVPATPAEAGTDFGRYLLNRIAVFSEWADRNGYSLDPLYDHQRIDSSITGYTRDVITMPVMALAEYEGADLRFVTPCAVDGEIVTVEDRLDELRTGGDVETTSLPDARGIRDGSRPLVHKR